MQDRVPLYPGRVTLTPVAGQANTYDMVRADQPSQEGTPLNKGSLLKDSTAALFGLGTDAVPDDALTLLSRFNKGLGNEYVWERLTPVTRYNMVLGGSQNENVVSNSRGAVVYYISDNVSLSADGVLTLVSPRSVTITRGGDIMEGLSRKYFYMTTSHSPFVANQIYLCGAYGSSSVGSNIWSSYQQVNVVSYQTTAPAGYVNSPDENAYPPAVPDGYTYNLLGKIGEASRIVLLKEIVTTEQISAGVLEVDLSDIDFAKYAYVHVDCKMNATTQVFYYINNSTSNCTYGQININGNSGATSGNECLGWFGDNERYKFAPWISFNVGYSGERFINCTRHNCLGVNPYVTFSQLQSMQFKCQGTIKTDSVIRVWGEG